MTERRAYHQEKGVQREKPRPRADKPRAARLFHEQESCDEHGDKEPDADIGVIKEKGYECEQYEKGSEYLPSYVCLGGTAKNFV